MDIQDLNIGQDGCGQKVVPGVKRNVYAVCACDVDATAWPSFLPEDPLSPGDSITLAGPIVLEANKFFASIGTIVDSGEVTHTQVGGKGFENYNNKFDFQVIKNKASDEWMNNNRNRCIIALIQEKDSDTEYRVLGNPGVPASFSASEGKTGKGSETEKIWNVTIMDTIGDVAPYYNDVVDIDPLT